MEQQSTQNQQRPEPAADKINQRPNEKGALNIDDFVRIYDPQTQQVFLEKRS